MDTRSLLIDKSQQLKGLITISAFLELIEDLDAITDDPEVDPVIHVHAFCKALINFINLNAAKPLTNSQLEAIAYATGYVDRTLPDLYKINKADSKLYSESNFLANSKQLKFLLFDKYLLALQLVVRIVNPKCIDQREEQVCGLSAFMQSIVKDQPLSYVKFVTDLVRDGHAKLKLSESAQGLNIIINDEVIFSRLSRKKKMQMLSIEAPGVERNVIEDVDYVALIGLAQSENALMTYNEDAGDLEKSLFGVTFPGQIKEWLTKIGYQYTQIVTLSSREDITRIKYLLEDGYACILQTTTDLVRLLQAKETQVDPEYGWRLPLILKGHFVTLSSIDFDHENNVILSIISWGIEFNNIKLPYTEFKAKKGFGNFIFGIAPGQLAALEKKSELQSFEDRVSPYWFIFNLRRDALFGLDSNSIPILNELTDALNTSYYHKNNESWFDTARRIQDALFKLVDHPMYANLDDYTKYRIDALREKYGRLYIHADHKANFDLVTARLSDAVLPKVIQKAVSAKDIYGLLLVCGFYLKNDKLIEAQDLIQKNLAWLSYSDKVKCQRLLDNHQINDLIVSAMKSSGVDRLIKLYEALSFPSNLVDHLKIRAIKFIIKEYSKAKNYKEALTRFLHKHRDLIKNYENEIQEYITVIDQKDAPISIHIQLLGRISQEFEILARPSSTYDDVKHLFIELVKGKAMLNDKLSANVLDINDIEFTHNGQDINGKMLVSSDQAKYKVSCRVKDYSFLVELTSSIFEMYAGSEKFRESQTLRLIDYATTKEIEKVSRYRSTWYVLPGFKDLFYQIKLRKMIDNLRYLSRGLMLYADSNIRLLGLLLSAQGKDASLSVSDFVANSANDNRVLFDKFTEIESKFESLGTLEEAQEMLDDALNTLELMSARRGVILSRCSLANTPELIDLNHRVSTQLSNACEIGRVDDMKSALERLTDYFQLPLVFVFAAPKVSPGSMFSFKTIRAESSNSNGLKPG